ncbi:MAG: glycosyltransferase family 4 protein [Candidatus Omnitrophota bacterium]
MNQPDLKPINAIIAASPLDMRRLQEEISRISSTCGIQAGYNTLLRVQAMLGLRKPSLAIYDHTGHIIGGGQKYGFTVAHALQDTFDVTLLLNRPIALSDIREWYHLDLSRCKIKIIPIPFFDALDPVHLDPARVTGRMENPFHLISRESGNYDFFINNSMNEKVYPLSNVSAMICHFPERRPKDYFYADRYTYVIYNSHYTAHWIEKKWNLKPHKHIYPPVDMAPEKTQQTQQTELAKKENRIISVARFEAGGSKKQLEMVQTFLKLSRRFPHDLHSWRLVLVGGSPNENAYLQAIKETIQKSGNENIELKVNAPADELKALYRKSAIFWHLCGLDGKDPALIEHFGMTIVEAMQNHIVPIVFDGGGQREIVEQNMSGFRVTSTAELMNATLRLIRDPKLREDMSRNAWERSQCFSKEVFETNVKDFFTELLNEYSRL